jgi:arginase family enzyme
VSDERPGFLEDKDDPGDIVLADNRYVLGLIPYEETTTYGKGVGMAPEAIVEASSHVELFDEVLEVDCIARRNPDRAPHHHRPGIHHPRGARAAREAPAIIPRLHRRRTLHHARSGRGIQAA